MPNFCKRKLVHAVNLLILKNTLNFRSGAQTKLKLPATLENNKLDVLIYYFEILLFNKRAKTQYHNQMNKYFGFKLVCGSEH